MSMAPLQRRFRNNCSPACSQRMSCSSKAIAGSTAIKYLSQSTWLHAALYVGSQLAEAGGNPAHCFIEADLVAGVKSVGIDMFAGLHTRICRAVGLNDDDRRAVTSFAIQRLGHLYDLRNIIDLARYLLPTPRVPLRFRRRMIALGSGDPTRAICPPPIAQALQSIRYPILPDISFRSANKIDSPVASRKSCGFGTTGCLCHETSTSRRIIR